MYIFHIHTATVLVVMHSLTPLVSLEFALIWEWGRKGYRSYSAELLFILNKTYPTLKKIILSKPNFITVRYDFQLKVYVEIALCRYLDSVLIVLSFQPMFFSVDTGSSRVFFWLPFREYLYLST